MGPDEIFEVAQENIPCGFEFDQQSRRINDKRRLVEHKRADGRGFFHRFCRQGKLGLLLLLIIAAEGELHSFFRG